MSTTIRAPPSPCSALAPLAARADDWPQWMGPKRDDVWREKGVLSSFPKGGPKELWRTKIAGGYSGPAVVGDKVYVMDFLTDADTNKAADPNQRAKGRRQGARPVPRSENRQGTLEARVRRHLRHFIPRRAALYADVPRRQGLHLRGDGGHLFCLDAKDKGKVIWSKDFQKDYKAKPPMWGWSSHPLIDGERLICVVGGKGSARRRVRQGQRQGVVEGDRRQGAGLLPADADRGRREEAVAHLGRREPQQPRPRRKAA